MSAPLFTPGPWRITVNNQNYPNIVDVWAGGNYMDRELLLFTPSRIGPARCWPKREASNDPYNPPHQDRG